MAVIPEKSMELVKRCLSVLRPPTDISVLEWADTYKILTSATSNEPGKWETSRRPYAVEPHLRITDKQVRQMVLMWASQTSKSEIINSIIGRYIMFDPVPMLLVQPTDHLAEDYSKERIDPLIQSTELKNYIRIDNIKHKTFKGGFLAFIGTQKPYKMASRPICICLADEIDRYIENSGGEGDPLSLIRKRQTTFGDKSKLVASGTPTTHGHSNIEKEYNKSSQGEWYLACPKCGHMQTLKFTNIKWDDKLPDEEKHLNIFMICEKCGEKSAEKAWKKNNQESGRWIHKRPDIVDNIGYHLNALALPSYVRTWNDIVKEFLTAKRNPNELVTFVNTVLAETWKEDNNNVDYEKLYRNREKYVAEVPDEVLIITAGVDIQDDWLAIKVTGWGINGSYAIEYRQIQGNFNEPQIWKLLDTYWTREFKYASEESLYIFAACVDTGGNHTQLVYNYISTRQSRRILAIKGQSGKSTPINNGHNTTKDGKAELFSLGVDALKDNIYNRLKIQPGEKGYCHFPKNIGRGFDIDYFMGLTAEQKNFENNKVVWKKIRTRNEPLDCEGYSTAPIYIFKVNLDILSTLTREQLKEISLHGHLLSNEDKSQKKIISKG
ncbi:MAG: phage terminase large subunit family protein, partial [Fusobacteriaceae bacterium]|nr:phage terminase large subunit family protein [Fusobacteriaceae bacterium]